MVNGSTAAFGDPRLPSHAGSGLIRGGGGYCVEIHEGEDYDRWQATVHTQAQWIQRAQENHVRTGADANGQLLAQVRALLDQSPDGLTVWAIANPNSPRKINGVGTATARRVLQDLVLAGQALRDDGQDRYFAATGPVGAERGRRGATGFDSTDNAEG